jgi:hypothetical protein
VRLAGGGLPSRQIEVTLELHGMLEGRAYTDGRGKFTFEGLGANTYTLIVREADFEPVRQSVRVMSSQGGAPVVAVITLRPLGGGQRWPLPWIPWKAWIRKLARNSKRE